MAHQYARYLNRVLSRGALVASRGAWKSLSGYTQPLFSVFFQEQKDCLLVYPRQYIVPSLQLLSSINRNSHPVLKFPLSPVSGKSGSDQDLVLYSNRRIPCRWLLMLQDFCLDPMGFNSHCALETADDENHSYPSYQSYQYDYYLRRLLHLPVHSKQELASKIFQAVRTDVAVQVRHPEWYTGDGTFSPYTDKILSAKCFRSLDNMAYGRLFRSQGGIEIPMHKFLTDWFILSQPDRADVYNEFVAQDEDGCTYSNSFDVPAEELVVLGEILRVSGVPIKYTSLELPDLVHL